jgi:hypothetical protein
LILTSHQYECSLPQDDAILSGQLTVWEPLYQAIVGEFTNTSDAGIFSGDRNTRQGTKHYSAMALTIELSSLLHASISLLSTSLSSAY